VEVVKSVEKFSHFSLHDGFLSFRVGEEDELRFGV